MMMIYGMLPFVRQTLPYNQLQHTINYRWPSSSRVGQRAAAQFIGPGDESITLNGELRPEITGGAISLLALRLLADQGLAWPLIAGNGTIFGMYVVESLDNTQSEFFANGSASKITFTLKLKRVDASLTALFGDLQEQVSGLADEAKNLATQVRGLM